MPTQLKNMKLLTISAMLLSAMSLTACQSVSTTMDSFRSQPEPEPRYIPDIIMGEVQTLLISPERIPCNTQLPMQCLLASTEGGMANSVFQVPYDGIEGFTPRAGMTYKISVRPLIDQNTQRATGRWHLESILSQRAVRAGLVN